jgi:transposase
VDNLSSHGGGRVGELIAGRGCELVYLPSYSPDLNPIDEAFPKVKDILREIGARTKESLIEAMRLL